MIILVLVLLGLCFGSFVNALVWRIHMQSKQKKNITKSTQDKYSISRGRSMCVHCKHELKTLDLIPVISWVMLKGKCRYCGRSVSWQYPLVELTTALLFVSSYVFWPYEQLSGIGVLTFSLWLAILVGLIALVVYDIRWMLLPNRIVYFLYAITTLFAVSRIADQGYTLAAVTDVALAVLVGGGIFYLLFQASKGAWIGGGDVKLGFILGAIVGAPYLALLMLFIASLLGSLYSLPLLVTKRATRATRIPFGPFLVVAAIIVFFFGVDLSDAYSRLFLGGTF